MGELRIVSLPPTPALVDSIIAHNEHIVSNAAIVVADDEGRVTVWYDLAKPVNILLEDEEDG